MAEGQKDGLDDLGFESSAFETLERDFQEVLTELVGDKSLERFRQEYEKLHRALKKSHESEKRLIKKCRELNSEIVSNAAKVQTALKLSQEDQNTIASLKREIEKAWKMVDASHEKESRAKETISQLKTEISNLSRLVEQGAGLSVGQENTVNELLKDKDELSEERDRQVEEIAALRVEISEYLQDIRAREAERTNVGSDISKIKEDLSTRKAEQEREVRRKERLEKEAKDLKNVLELRGADLKARNGALAQAQASVDKTEESLRLQKLQTDKASRELKGSQKKLAELDEELKKKGLEHAEQKMMNDEQQAELHREEEELAKLRHDVAKQTKAKDAQLKKLRVVEEGRYDIQRQVDAVKKQAAQLEREIDTEKREISNDRQTKSDLAAELEELKRSLGRASDSTTRQQDIVKLNATMIKTLEGQINAYKQESMKQRKKVYHLEKEREKFGAEASDGNAKFMAALEEVKLREMTILDLQKKIAEGDSRLKQQQNLYEAVRSDRNLYSKSLIESQDEIAEMKRKFKIMNHQIEQLKEEIHVKDQNLVREHFDRMKVEKEKELLRDHLGKLRTREQQSEDYVAQMLAETTKLNAIINEADKERQRQRKECEVVVNERDILGTQLIRRNEELALLYEKIRIQKSTLQKGEQQYTVRTKEISTLKRRIRELGGQLSAVGSAKGSVETLRNEVYQLQRELLHERTKVRALSEELENPMNVHRWRKLEGSDPATYELVQKTHMLQKRLIEKSEEVVDKDLLIRHKEKLYLELKNILARQPGPEVAEQLSTYQASLSERAKQMEQMEAELSMSHTQASEYKYEIARINKELREVKKKFYDQRKREQHLAETRRAERAVPTELLVQEARSTLNRFTGGGFNLNMSGT